MFRMVPHGSPLHCLVSPWFCILFFYFFDVPHGSPWLPIALSGFPVVPRSIFCFFDVPHGSPLH